MPLPLVGLMAGRLAGWLADEMWVDFKIFKILYRLNYSDFTSFSIVIMLLYYYLCVSTDCFQLKLILRCVLRHKKFCCHFFPRQSLLSSTIILNDTPKPCIYLQPKPALLLNVLIHIRTSMSTTPTFKTEVLSFVT